MATPDKPTSHHTHPHLQNGDYRGQQAFVPFEAGVLRFYVCSLVGPLVCSRDDGSSPLFFGLCSGHSYMYAFFRSSSSHLLQRVRAFGLVTLAQPLTRTQSCKAWLSSSVGLNSFCCLVRAFLSVSCPFQFKAAQLVNGLKWFPRAFRGYAERKRRKRENDSAAVIQRQGPLSPIAVTLPGVAWALWVSLVTLDGVEYGCPCLCCCSQGLQQWLCWKCGGE